MNQQQWWMKILGNIRPPSSIEGVSLILQEEAIIAMATEINKNECNLIFVILIFLRFYNLNFFRKQIYV
jgi:hypothetical protein